METKKKRKSPSKPFNRVGGLATASGRAYHLLRDSKSHPIDEVLDAIRGDASKHRQLATPPIKTYSALNYNERRRAQRYGEPIRFTIVEHDEQVQMVIHTEGFRRYLWEEKKDFILKGDNAAPKQEDAAKPEPPAEAAEQPPKEGQSMPLFPEEPKVEGSTITSAQVSDGSSPPCESVEARVRALLHPGDGKDYYSYARKYFEVRAAPGPWTPREIAAALQVLHGDWVKEQAK